MLTARGRAVSELYPKSLISCEKAHCCSRIPPPGACPLISEDVALPQEEEGTSCHWPSGLRAAGIFRMPSPQLWELGMQLRFPSRGGLVLSRGQSQGLETWYRRKLEAEQRSAASTPPVPRNVLFSEGSCNSPVIHSERQSIAYHKETFCRVSCYNMNMLNMEKETSLVLRGKETEQQRII